MVGKELAMRQLRLARVYGSSREWEEMSKSPRVIIELYQSFMAGAEYGPLGDDGDSWGAISGIGEYVFNRHAKRIFDAAEVEEICNTRGIAIEFCYVKLPIGWKWAARACDENNCAVTRVFVSRNINVAVSNVIGDLPFIE